jgi:ketosteroid isomerase-like protein
MFRPPTSPDEKGSSPGGKHGRKPMLRQLTEALHRRLLEVEQAAQSGTPGALLARYNDG